jgi:hypothetical protein
MLKVDFVPWFYQSFFFLPVEVIYGFHRHYPPTAAIGQQLGKAHAGDDGSGGAFLRRSFGA